MLYRLRYVVVSAVMAAGAITAITLGSTLAQAAPPAGTLGTLTMDPATGSDVLVPKVHTSAGCPDTADAYWAYVKGPGKFGAGDGYLITPTTDVNLSHTGGFDVRLGVSMKDAATELGTTVVAGEYDVTVSCVDSFAVKPVGTFTMAMYFTSPTTYETTPQSTTTPSAGASATPSASAPPSASATPSAEASASATPGPSDSATPAPSGSAAPSAVATTPAAGGTGGSLPVTGTVGALYVLGGVTLLVLGAAGLLATHRTWRTRRSGH